MIWDLQEWTGKAVLHTAVAKKTGMKMSTVSGAITRLSSAGLVQHNPYGAITLTDEGRKYALVMVRRHRLLETMLVRMLGYTWDEVHTEADALEHAVSDLFIERVDKILKHPTHDPHGDPIPTADGKITLDSTTPLSEASEDTTVSVARVSDEDPELLRYLTRQGIGIGTKLRIGRKEPYSNSLSLTVNAGRGRSESSKPQAKPAEFTLGLSAASLIRIHAPE